MQQLAKLLNPRLPKGPGHLANWGELPSCALSLLLQQTLADHQAPIVVFCKDMTEALNIEQELTFFMAEQQLVKRPILTLPDWETLPYDSFSPPPDLISDRLLALASIKDQDNYILILPLTTAIAVLPPPVFVASSTMDFKVGSHCKLEQLRNTLIQSGYYNVSEVYQHGEFATRGSILDIFPMGCAEPIRLDLFDDEIDSIRYFDTETQRTTEKLESFTLLPAHEFPLDEAGINHFRASWRATFAGDPTKVPIYENISEGIATPGIEYYLPLFFDQTATLFDYLPESSLLVLAGELDVALQNYWQEIDYRYDQFRHDVLRPLLPPEQLFLKSEQFFSRCKSFARIKCMPYEGQPAEMHIVGGDEGAELHNAPNFFQKAEDGKSTSPKDLFHGLKPFLEQSDKRCLITAESAGRREVLLNLLHSQQIRPITVESFADFVAGDMPLAIVVAPIARGLIIQSQQLAIIAEANLLGQRVAQRGRRQKSQAMGEQTIKNLNELALDSPVVHIEHGVGRYKGLMTLDVDDVPAEFLQLEYANNAKLYVPVASLHLISRYSGADSENAPLNKLGSGQWEKAKKRALTQARDVAAELLNIYARRAARKGFACKKPDDSYAVFANSFPFEETTDQQQAIDNVVGDLVAEQAMDRLVCGDVGFGKTEVAMRAAFVACQTGRQVAVLVPTTLLAQQHFASFSDRFADWPIEVEVLSRFKTAKQSKEIMARLEAGQVDVIIGTHKLLTSDIKFKNLGLLIIDEEHRFGVRQKERIKKLRAEVDILTLTATPIPRTMNMAMSGLRDLSIIGTPPQRRLSIKTFVREMNPGLIKEAITREILRGGQVYFLHNDVRTIERAAEQLQELVPEAKIRVGHGQMRERQLESVMADFYHHRFNVLVCTTIIETGIDIPAANTIIIERADKFGLAQLHQLRGRVGRSHHQAYAYLFTPPVKALTADAKKRLEAIEQTQDLGSGFSLATHDLEIRGAGELLGEGQSGNITTVGLSLYTEMLTQAVESLKSGHEPDLEDPFIAGTEVDCKLPALIPNDYIADPHIRLVSYKRIASATSDTALQELQVELIDRFGPLPASTKTLFAITELRLTAQEIGIKKIEANATGGKLTFREHTKIDPLRIIKLIQSRPNEFKLDGPLKLIFKADLGSEEKRIKYIAGLLSNLQQTNAA